MEKQNADIHALTLPIKPTIAKPCSPARRALLVPRSPSSLVAPGQPLSCCRVTLTDLPPYRHDDPGPGFATLDMMLRELLDTVISTRFFSITLDQVRPSFFLGRIDSGKIDDKTTFYLAVSADMSSAELVDAVPARFKLGAPDDVDKLVQSAMPGIKVAYAPQVPPAIPVRPGACYFAIEARGPIYERMLQAQSMMIYAPSGIDHLQLELIAITS